MKNKNYESHIIGFHLFDLTCQKDKSHFLKKAIQYKKNQSKNSVKFVTIDSHHTSSSNETIADYYQILAPGLKFQSSVVCINELSKKLNNPELKKLKKLPQLSNYINDLNKGEIFILSLIKGIYSHQPLLIIQIPDTLNYQDLTIIKKILFHEILKGKEIYLETSNISFWLDCSQTIILWESNTFREKKLRSLVSKMVA